MTLALHIDWASGAVQLEQVRIETGADGALAPDAQALCGPAETTLSGGQRYRVTKQAGLCGYAAQCVIDVKDGKLASVAVLFELIRFFDASLTESKIVQAVAAASGLQVVSTHPAKATLEPCSWGVAQFSYDPRQGDLSLMLRYA
jgi:hypothetical protein